MKGKSLQPVLLRLLLLLNFVFPLGVLGKSEKTSDEYLNEAKEFLAQGNQQEALNSMDEAISKDPSNYLSLYKRAVIHISLGRSKSALDDLDRVLELSPQFDQAVLHRARLHSRDCRLDLAKKDLNSIEKKGQEAYEMISDIDKAKLNMEIFERLKDDGKLDSEIQRIKGKKGAESETVEKAKRLLGEIIAVCAGDGSLRLKRAEIYESLGDIPMAIGDYTRAASLLNDNLSILQKVTELHAKNGDLDMAIVALKQCLHYDPENKKCSKQFKMIKKLLKNFDEADKKIEGRKYRAALDEYLDPLKERKKMKGTQKGIIESLDELEAGGQARKRALVMICEAYFRLKRADDAIDWCSKAIELTDDTNTLCNRAEAYLLKDEFKKASDDFSRARDLSNGTPSQRILEGLQKTQKLERMAKKKDYYKILGVDKQADDATIKKAFRSLAKQYHPDKYRGDPKIAQDKMAELNQAYEVLSNKELRQRYDNGDDPNDPMSGQEGFQQGGGFPFGGPVFFQSGGFPGGGGGGRHGGFPFGAGGFEFRFN